MIRIREIKIPVSKPQDIHLKKVIIQKLNISNQELIHYVIKRQSIDARHKPDVYYVYEVDVTLNNEEKVLSRIKSPNIFQAPNEEYIPPQKGETPMTHCPIIVGSGPAGLFAAYLLSEMGYRPLIIERGKPIAERIKDVEDFWQNNKLNPESNVSFGEGGAGTFSDGKLNTLVKDSRFIGKKVFEIFVKYGAPEEIMYSSHPHIGTDVLRTVIANIREAIIQMGGQILYNTQLTNIILNYNKLEAIEVNHQEKIPCEALILATGHSARDTYEMLSQYLKLESKPFAIGLRVIHLQQMINESQYGSASKYLPNASYKLTYQTSQGRGIYSFCMCPGGYVVNASSEPNHLVVNGMSNYLRDTKTANSAIIVTITPNDYGNEPLSGIAYQRELESLTYKLGKGNIPIQLWQDFLLNRKSTSLGTVPPIVKGNYTLANIREILPSFITEALLEAMPVFNKKIHGFANPDTILCAIESRTSSPVRIPRNENYESQIQGIYPCGEGAGYAGGITTSAIDGIKVAESIIKKYRPF